MRSSIDLRPIRMEPLINPDMRKGASNKMAERNGFFEEILSHGPSAGSVVVILRRMKEEGRLKEVIQTCIRFLQPYPDDIQLRTLLAESYAEAGFISLAQTEFEKVAAMIDRLVPAYRFLGELYAKQQRVEEAADMLKRYLAHFPDQADVIEFLKKLESTPSSKEGALEIERPAEDGVPSTDESADALVDFATPTIAELYYSQGRLDAAIHTYETVLNSRPDDHASRVRLNELKGMIDAATPVAADRAELSPRARKERLVLTLERWLPKIREIRHA